MSERCCWSVALRLGEGAPRRLRRPAHIPSVGIRCRRARRTSSPCTARGAPGDNVPLRATRRGATPVRPSSLYVFPAWGRLGCALVETSADLCQQLCALSVRLLQAGGARLVASHRELAASFRPCERSFRRGRARAVGLRRAFRRRALASPPARAPERRRVQPRCAVAIRASSAGTSSSRRAASLPRGASRLG